MQLHSERIQTTPVWESDKVFVLSKSVSLDLIIIIITTTTIIIMMMMIIVTIVYSAIIPKLPY